MAVRFTAAARRAIDHALGEAERRHHSVVDTGHLLLGVLANGPAAAAALAGLGVDVSALRAAADASLAPVDGAAPTALDFDASVELVLQRADALSRARGAPEVSDADILVACAERTGTRAAVLLAASGAVPDALREVASSLATPDAPPAAAGVVTRVGTGYDSHRFAPGGPMRLGGIDVPSDVRLVGHSDGDAIAHALTDAILGAAGAGDIGEMFADSDPANRGRDSIGMLRAGVARVRARGWRVQQVDVTVIAERPRIGPHREAMRAVLAQALGVAPDAVSVKGKTNEGMGWIGRGEGLACIAVASLVSAENREPGAERR